MLAQAYNMDKVASCHFRALASAVHRIYIFRFLLIIVLPSMFSFLLGIQAAFRMLWENIVFRLLRHIVFRLLRRKSPPFLFLQVSNLEERKKRRSLNKEMKEGKKKKKWGLRLVSKRTLLLVLLHRATTAFAPEKRRKRA